MDLIGQAIAEQEARAERRLMEAEIQARIRQAYRDFLRENYPDLYARLLVDEWLDADHADHAATAV